MKRNNITLFICLCVAVSQAQIKYIDSLDNLIRMEKSDTARINLINKKISKLHEINLDSSQNLAIKTLDDAQKIKFKKGEADVLLNMVTNFIMKGEYDSAKKYIADAQSIATELNNRVQIAKVNSSIGMFYGVQSKYDSSAIYYKKAIDQYQELGDKKSMGTAYGNLAISYLMQSNHPQALFYQQKALQIAEEENNLNSQAYVLMNMGNTYQNMGDTLKSEQSFLRGIKIARQESIRNVELYGYSNVASLYYDLKKWDESYKYAMKAEELAKTMGDASIQAASMSKASLALMQTKKYAEAEELASQSIKLADSAGQPLTIHQAYASKGKILIKQEKYAAAIPLLEKSVNNNADGYNEFVADAYENLSLGYENTGNYVKALNAFKTSAKIKDSVRSNENIRKATELSMNFDFDKKQALAAAEQEKKDINAQRLKNRQLFIIIAMGTILLSILVISFILFRNNKQKQKVNLLLKNQNQKVEKTLSELKDTQAQLIQSEKMASLGELTAGIAHEIQNPLNFVNNFSEINQELIQEMQDELSKGNLEEVREISNDIKGNEEKINHHGKRADSIVKGMLQHSRTNNGLKEPTDINALADEYLRLAYHGLRAKDKSFNADFKTDFDPHIPKIKVVPQDFGRVLLNLINNAFQAINGYSEKPEVIVRTLKKGNSIEIKVMDNGPGIPKEIRDKIFQPFFTTKPTGQGTGLGLSLSYDIVKAHGGELKVTTKEGVGTEFIISLPITNSR